MQVQSDINNFEPPIHQVFCSKKAHINCLMEEMREKERESKFSYDMEVGRKRNMDESFRKPGSIPFKWEIRPGIPKPHPSPTTTPLPLPPKLRSHPSSNPLSPSGSTSRAFPSQGCFPIPSVKHRDDRKGAEPITWLQLRSMSARFTPLFGKSTQAKDCINLDT